jgi:DNA-binding NarL/FixJ family response regulator
MEEETTRSVLIVDDDEDVRDALRLLFELEDFEVVGEAPNGLDAIPMVLQRRPQVVVIDYLMPLMNGATLAQVVRGVSPDTKIVAFSAVLTSQPAWADAYLSKERINDIAPLITHLIPSVARKLDQAPT